MISLIVTGCIEQNQPVETARIRIICPTCPIDGLGYAPVTVTVFAEYPVEAQDYLWEVQRLNDMPVQRLAGRVIVITFTEPGQYTVKLQAVYRDGYVIEGKAYLFIANRWQIPSVTITIRVSDNQSGEELLICEALVPKTVTLGDEFYIHTVCVNRTQAVMEIVYLSIIADMRLIETAGELAYDRPFFYLESGQAIELRSPYRAISTGMSTLTVQVQASQGRMGGKAQAQIPILIRGGVE